MRMTTQHRDEPIVRVVNVQKSFGETHAVRDVSLELRAGEVHVLLGENGAGKSTLIALLTGLQQPDAGHISIEGVPTQLSAPRVALDEGIIAVLQRSNMVAELSLRDNLRLAGLTTHEQQGRVAQVLQTLHGAGVSFETRVGALDLGVRHLAEIARAVARQPRVLILDEPTALMGSLSAERLLQLLRELTADGVGVLFVTHKLTEAKAIADEMTVMRAGEVVLRGNDASEPELLRALFGSSPVQADALAAATQRSDPRARAISSIDHPPALRLDSVTTPPIIDECGLNAVSLAVHPGRIVGIAGISGNGQSQLVQVIEGSRAPESGSVWLNGVEVSGLSIRERMTRGLRTVPDDRFGEGLVSKLSLGLNLLLNRIGSLPFWRFGITRREAISAHASEVMASASIVATSPDAPVATLSGGNAQKLLLARALQSHSVSDAAPEATVTVFHQPTHGLDAKTVTEVFGSIRALANTGGAVLVISSDLDEIVALSDEVLVIESGQIVATVEGHAALTRDQIAQAISVTRS
jgi:simple sugar transport system ATP-binding protein